MSRTITIYGLMRIKNEARWIERVIRSQLGLVERIFILDDHSTDETREICRRFSEVTLFESPFAGLDEARDKQWLLERVFQSTPAGRHAAGDPNSPYWALCLDGDEELVAQDKPLIQEVLRTGRSHCYSLQILYLWDKPDLVRVDGVYGSFFRPSIFRLMNAAFDYKRTPSGRGANLHCSSVPQEFLAHALPCGGRVLHWGYLHAEDRLRKWRWYNTIDPGNRDEDLYRHVVQGDTPEVPAGAKLRWAGPLRLVPLQSLLG